VCGLDDLVIGVDERMVGRLVAAVLVIFRRPARAARLVLAGFGHFVFVAFAGRHFLLVVAVALLGFHRGIGLARILGLAFAALGLVILVLVVAFLLVLFGLEIVAADLDVEILDQAPRRLGERPLVVDQL